MAGLEHKLRHNSGEQGCETGGRQGQNHPLVVCTADRVRSPRGIFSGFDAILLLWTNLTCAFSG